MVVETELFLIFYKIVADKDVAVFLMCRPTYFGYKSGSNI